ncbi:unnamed protein product [Alternaria alternata]
MAFFAGVLYAELSASASSGQHEILSLLPPSRRYNWRLSPFKTVLHRLSSLSRYSVFLLGIYLLCLPIRIQSDGTIDANFPPDWFFLEWCPPLQWWNTETTMRTWHTFGAILVIGGEPRGESERYSLRKATSAMTPAHKEADAEKAEKASETRSKKQRSHALDAVVAS